LRITPGGKWRAKAPSEIASTVFSAGFALSPRAMLAASSGR